MEAGLFLRGIVLGFSIAAPVGPIGVLVIHRTLAEGRLLGLLTGLGAATADALYGLLGALGLAALSAWLLAGDSWLRLLGGLFLCYLGLRTWRAVPAERPAPAGGATYLRAYVSSVALTLSNPLTILSFAAAFAGLGAGLGGAGSAAPVLFVAGVFLGSALWWLLLSSGLGLLRAKLGAPELRWINRISGAIMLVFGALALLSLL